MKSVSHEEAEQVKEQDIAKQKLDCTVYQESGTNPAVISVVLPTFNNGRGEYIDTMSMIMRKIGKLIDRGTVDELVIVDGSRDKEGMPDSEFIKFMLALCIKNCETFRREVDFVRSMPEGKQKSMEGRFDFSVRFLSQLDPLLHKIFLDHNLLKKDEVEFLKSGKGAGLWYSIPVTYGDIVCFIDSDIKSFHKYYVSSLCKPILDSWSSDCKSRESNPGVVYSKAVYVRKNERAGSFGFGGRLERMGVAPMFRALAKMGRYKGLEKLKYHISGEYAFAIDALKDIRFSNGYDIETSILCQLWKKYGMERLAEVDLGVYQHIPGSEGHVKDMMGEVASAIRYWSKRHGQNVNAEEFFRAYREEGKKIGREYRRLAKEYSGFAYGDADEREDLARLDAFEKILRSAWSEDRKPKLLRPWRELEKKADSEKGYSYQNLKLTLRKRINKFTSKMILSSIYIDRSDDIIQKYSSLHGS